MGLKRLLDYLWKTSRLLNMGWNGKQAFIWSQIRLDDCELVWGKNLEMANKKSLVILFSFLKKSYCFYFLDQGFWLHELMCWINFHSLQYFDLCPMFPLSNYLNDTREQYLNWKTFPISDAYEEREGRVIWGQVN